MKKWYVLTLLILIGFVGSASAAQIDSKVMGVWVSRDAPCNPCTLTIKSDQVTFAQVRSQISVLGAHGTSEPGIHLFLGTGGELDLVLTTSGMLVGRYADPQRPVANRTVVFQPKH